MIFLHVLLPIITPLRFLILLPDGMRTTIMESLEELWRLVKSSRRKIVEALIAGRTILIEPGGELEEVKEGENNLSKT